MLSINKKLLVFPTSRAIRDYIKKERGSNKLLPSFLTIDEFFKKAISIGDKKFIDEEQRFLYLKEASNIKNLKKLGISNDFSSFIKQSDYLFRFFGELSSEKVKIEDIETYDTYEFYGEHIQILKTIYQNYNKILNENHAVDKINLPNNYQINQDFIDGLTSIEIYFEGYFTQYEFEIIYTISKLKDTFLNFTSNQYNQKSIQNIIDLGFEIEEGFEYKINLHKNEIIQKNKYLSKLKDIKIEAFSNRTNQIAFIKESISKIINSNIKAENIALVVPDESFISTLQLFDIENYFNYAMGKNIFNSNIYKVSQAINQYLNENEKKNSEALDFYNIDKKTLEEDYKSIWNKNIIKNDFITFINYLKSFETNKDIIKKVDELFYKLTHLFFTNPQKILFKEVVKIFIQKLGKLTLDDVNSGVITVIGLLESRAVTFDAVIICDFNENFIPKKSIKDKFLSSKIKKAVKLPTQNDRENLQKYYYYKLLNNSQKAYISYVSNENMQITRFSNELFKDIKIDTKPKDNEYKHILFQTKQIDHFSDEIIKKIDLSKQSWSASSLKKYLECKRKYYLEYIVGIKEHTNSLKPKGYELGTFVHDCLEDFYKLYNISEISYEKLVNIYEKESTINPFLLLDKEIFKKNFEQFIIEEQNRDKKGAKIIALEKSFNFEHKGIRLKGVIDRIDKLDNIYEVIDYKTSASLKIDTIKNYEKSVDFQLEFYFLACKELYSYENIKAFYYDLSKVKLLEELTLFEKLDLLDKIFEDLHTTEVNFEKCENSSVCQFCNFKTICDR